MSYQLRNRQIEKPVFYRCKTELGWKHEPANEQSQQFTRKGGHFFIGLVHMSVPNEDTKGQEFIK